MTAIAQRLFFALWPDPATRDQLQEWQARLGLETRALTHRDDFHLTLHFLGQVNAEGVASLQSLGDGLLIQRFALSLDHIGVFPKAKVLWAGLQTVPAALLALHAEVGQRLADREFTLEPRAYRPHLTLARKFGAPLPQLDLPVIDWRADQWGLFASRPGTRPLYQPLRLWNLA